jgi:hypothetical protein
MNEEDMIGKIVWINCWSDKNLPIVRYGFVQECVVLHHARNQDGSNPKNLVILRFEDSTIMYTHICYKGKEWDVIDE